MPWNIVKRGSKWCVVKKQTGETIPGGCHDSKPEAEAQMRALYANVKETGKAE
jgi:hypothetical protein